MSERLKSILFAAALCVVCSLFLTAAATGLKGFQEKNIILDKHKNILRAVGLIDTDHKLSASAIEDLFRRSIRRIWIKTSGSVVPEAERSPGDLPLYVHVARNKLEAYILPIDTKGLWGRIQGYMAIRKDGSTIVGFTVFKHTETPGLGGEIEKEWFQRNFMGKRIVDLNGEFVSIAIAKGAVAQTIAKGKQPNWVDGISGATLTGRFLTAGMKENLLMYEPVAIRFRSNRIEDLKQ